MNNSDVKDFTINMRLFSPFVIKINELVKKYPESFARMNGLHEDNLNFNTFIDNFIEEKTVADASIDGNANVSTKDICSLESEMSKPHKKLLSLHKIYYEIYKKYGVETADTWLEDEWNGASYLHDSYSASMKPYCFSGDTRFLTKSGIKRLDEMCGKKVKVLNKNRGWEDAEVKSFGKAPLMKITFERYGVTKTVRATENHRWFVREVVDYKDRLVEYETKDLTVGMRVPFNATNVWSQVDPSPFGVAHGFFIGDSDKVKLRANFCGDKTALLPYFTPANIQGNEVEYSVIGVPKSFVELPSLDETPNYLYGFLSGYFAADGCVDTRGRCTISSTIRENLECVRDILCVLGMPVNEIRSQTRVSNLTNEEGIVYTLSLSAEYLREEFFIRPQHKERFIPNQERKDRNWIVRSVEKTDDVEEVYCAVTESTGSFTLDNNILTHNCFAYSLENLVDKGLYFVTNFKSEAPKHLMTYVRDVLEFVSWTSNRTSGACGLPDFLIYSFYFWKHDVENNYYLVSPEYYMNQGFQEIIYGLNQPYLRINQSAFTNFTIMDRYYLIEMFGDKVFPDGTLVIDYIDDILDYQLAFLEEVSKTRSKTMFTFPVLTFSLLKKKDIDMGKVGSWDYSVFEDEDYARKLNKHNMTWADSNFFSDTDVTSLSSCCRLVNDFSKLTGFINSIGGTQLKIGSVKVNTINLARIALESGGDEDKYFEILKNRVDTCVKVLDCIRHIIERNVEKGLLPNYSYNLIELKNQYNTIGINGMFEAVRHMKGTDVDEFGNYSYNDKGLSFAIKILDEINAQKDSYGFNYSINVEAVPAERCAVILLAKDKELFGDEVTSKYLYGNQWIPLDERCTISEKIRLGSILDKKCGGGQIMHLNISGDFADEKQAWSTLNKIVAQGVIYFAYNKKISVCENGHGFFGDTCPECGAKKVDEVGRIVGFLTPRSTYSKERKSESNRRYYYDLNDSF